MLCATCIGMVLKPSFEPQPHHASFDVVVKAAQAGCKICKSLLLWREQFGPDEAGEKETESFNTYNCSGMDNITFQGQASWLGKGTIVLQRLESQCPQETPPWWIDLLKDVKTDLNDEPWRVRPDQFLGRNIAPNTGDVEVSRQALDWLDKCKNEHSFCQQVESVREQNFLPPRLIEIPQDELSGCRLVDTKPEVGAYKYVALSHCWGKNPSFLNLTASNEAQLRQCISMADLPKSFREAIQTCKRLGIYYIWIDSLCILQSGSGSNEDWQYHTTLMGEVYANCELNIAVARASDASQGCYVDRDAHFLQTAYIYERSGVLPDTKDPLDAWIQASQETRVEASLTVVYDAENDGFAGPSSHHPLNRRGWVFQERLMSPRTLHFGMDRVIWECLDKACNEYFPTGVPNYRYTFPGREVHKPSLARLILKSGPSIYWDEDEFDSMHYRWNKLVEAYSKTDLTYPTKDKLAAIAAIAKRFGQFLPDRYVAGLFLLPSSSSSQLPDPHPVDYDRAISPGGPRYDYRSTPLFRLAWHTLSETSKRYREDDETWESVFIDTGPYSLIQSPSWSWASLNCEISIAGYPYTYDLARIDDISVELANPDDPYGQVAAAEITLTGPTSEIDASAWQDHLRNQSQNNTYRKEKSMQQDNDETLTAMFLTSGGSEGYNATCGLLLTRQDAETWRRVGYVELMDREGKCLDQGTVTKTMRIV